MTSTPSRAQPDDVDERYHSSAYDPLFELDPNDNEVDIIDTYFDPSDPSSLAWDSCEEYGQQRWYEAYHWYHDNVTREADPFSAIARIQTAPMVEIVNGAYQLQPHEAGGSTRHHLDLTSVMFEFETTLTYWDPVNQSVATHRPFARENRDFDWMMRAADELMLSPSAPYTAEELNDIYAKVKEFEWLLGAYGTNARGLAEEAIRWMSLDGQIAAWLARKNLADDFGPRPFAIMTWTRERLATVYGDEGYTRARANRWTFAQDLVQPLPGAPPGFFGPNDGIPMGAYADWRPPADPYEPDDGPSAPPTSDDPMLSSFMHNDVGDVDEQFEQYLMQRVPEGTRMREILMHSREVREWLEDRLRETFAVLQPICTQSTAGGFSPCHFSPDLFFETYQARLGAAQARDVGACRRFTAGLGPPEASQLSDRYYRTGSADAVSGFDPARFRSQIASSLSAPVGSAEREAAEDAAALITGLRRGASNWSDIHVRLDEFTSHVTAVAQTFATPGAPAPDLSAQDFAGRFAPFASNGAMARAMDDVELFRKIEVAHGFIETLLRAAALESMRKVFKQDPATGRIDFDLGFGEQATSGNKKVSSSSRASQHVDSERYGNSLPPDKRPKSLCDIEMNFAQNINVGANIPMFGSSSQGTSTGPSDTQGFFGLSSGGSRATTDASGNITAERLEPINGSQKKKRPKADGGGRMEHRGSVVATFDIDPNTGEVSGRVGYNHTVRIGFPSIPIMPFVQATADAVGMIGVGVDYRVKMEADIAECGNYGPEVFVGANASVSLDFHLGVSVGASIGFIGLEAGVRGKLRLARVVIEANRLHASEDVPDTIQNTPEVRRMQDCVGGAPGSCVTGASNPREGLKRAIRRKWRAEGGEYLLFETLSGTLQVYATFFLPFFSETVEHDIISWPGFRVREGDGIQSSLSQGFLEQDVMCLPDFWPTGDDWCGMADFCAEVLGASACP